MDVAGRRLLYRDTSGAVVAFDLVSFHERTVAPRGAFTALGADGALLAVERSGAVIESQPWGTRAWPDTLGAGVRDVFAAPGARLLAVRNRSGDTLLTVARDGGVSSAIALPAAADRTASREGDALALATDSGIVVIEVREQGAAWFVRLAGAPRAVVFSPSGHRLYVAQRGRDELTVIDRYQRVERSAIPLPGPAGAIRPDPWGRALLIRPSGEEGSGGETWVVGVAEQRVLGRFQSEWDTDLPTVSPSGVLLDREGDAVVSRDVRTLDSLGAVPDGSADYWFVGAWAPPRTAATARQQARQTDAGAARAAARPPAPTDPRPAATRPPDRTTVAPPPPAVTPPVAAAPANATAIWVQVSASASESASRGLTAELARSGHAARLVAPRSAGDTWRVLLGPYATRDAAEAAGRALGRPFFLVERAASETVRP